MKKPYIIALATILILVGLRIAIINYPSPSLPPEQCIEKPPTECALIFDEYYYVPAARKLLNGEAVNNEHPPLSKLLIALGIRVFGDNPIGWRFFPSILSSIAVGFLVLLAWELTRRMVVVWVSAVLLGADIMFLNVGSIAILDGPAVFFTVLGAFLYIRNQYILSGLILSLALLSKTSSLFAYLGLLTYTFLNSLSDGGWGDAVQKTLRAFERTSIPMMALFLAGLTFYDLWFGAYNNPFAHLDYMLAYHTQLRYTCVSYILPFRCVERSGTIIDLPFSWISPIQQFQPMPFNVVTASAGEKTWHPIAYWGIYSPYWWTTLVVIPTAIHRIIINRRNHVDIRVESFTLSWLALNYGIYYPIAYLFNRWVYPFYFVMSLPGLVIGLSYMLDDGKFSRAVLLAITVAQLLWAFIYFPVRSDPHIEILRALNLPT
ncbi:putative dolichyl-phosphate-mannose--protein mannosyltransferase [archaeon HR01]|nr:putative dolichyl-phosphate-mannose--protein mannosyltransferase [archaeon HR01]